MTKYGITFYNGNNRNIPNILRYFDQLGFRTL